MLFKLAVWAGLAVLLVLIAWAMVVGPVVQLIRGDRRRPLP